MNELSNKYNNLIKQYQDTYIELQNVSPSNFIKINKHTFWGQSAISETNYNTIDECQEACKNKKNCSGATFNNALQYCWIRSGNGEPIVSANINENAIIKQSLYLTYKLKQINTQLLDINNQMMNLLTQQTNIYITDTNTNKYKKALMMLENAS